MVSNAATVFTDGKCARLMNDEHRRLFTGSLLKKPVLCGQVEPICHSGFQVQQRTMVGTSRAVCLLFSSHNLGDLARNRSPSAVLSIFSTRVVFADEGLRVAGGVMVSMPSKS